MSTPLRTLIVEDNEDDALLLVRELRRAGYDPSFELVDTAEAMEHALEGQEWDVIIADYRMPHFNGLDALEIMKLKGLDIPFIILSGVIIEDMAIVAMRKGARDCIMKHNLPRLFPAIERELQEAEERRKRRQAEQEVRESEKKFRMLFESASDAIFIHDLEGHFLEVNEVACERLGYSKEEFLQMTPTDTDAPEYAALVPKRIEELRQYGRITFETIQIHRDGTKIPTEINSRAIDFAGIPAIISISRDITERKRAEEKIRTLNEELELRVKMRTAELEATNTELKDFAHIVSHDLKAPLRGIHQLVDWLVEDYVEAFDKKGKEMIALLLGRVRRMDSLIDGILRYSRAGRTMKKNERVNLNRLVNDVIDLIAPPAHIQIIIENDLPSVSGDPTRIEQVFQNLLSNAVKFMDKASGEIRIRTFDTADSWTFSISDNGPGIDKRHHERIFQVFQSLAPREQQESTGIGLAVVKKIVELHNGKIWLESSPENGSTFFFTLPRDMSSPHHQHQAVAPCP